jgi:hypothetical protein
MQDTRFMTKLLAIAKQEPELPLFPNTHLPTFRKEQQNGTTQQSQSKY